MGLITRKVVRFWEISAAVALLFSLALFICQFIFDFPIDFIHVIHIIEVVIVSVFLGEVTVQLLYTDNRLLYLKKNWFYILTILPLIGMLRVMAAGNVAHLTRIFGFLGHAAESGNAMRILGIFTPTKLLFTKELTSMVYHFSRTDFRKISPMAPQQKIFVYTSPHVEKTLSNGIIRGVIDYVEQTMHKKVMLVEKDWVEIFKKEQDLLKDNDFVSAPQYMGTLKAAYTKDWHIMVTDIPLLDLHEGTGIGHKHDNGAIALFSSNAIQQSSAFNHIEKETFSEAMGKIMGYHSFLHYDKPCYLKGPCVHRPLTVHDLNLLAFMHSMNGTYPICELHRSK